MPPSVCLWGGNWPKLRHNIDMLGMPWREQVQLIKKVVQSKSWLSRIIGKVAEILRDMTMNDKYTS